MDYAIRISGLTSPPSVAYTSVQYRPGVTVVNEGVSTNSAQGTLRIYSKASGLLIGSFTIASGDIAPGNSKVCQSDTYWLPPQTGDYFAIAAVAADRASAQLPPTYFVVLDTPPPPPPTVPEHAEQHQDGQADELNVAGLSGQLVDEQHPEPHASNHQANEPDEIDVTGLDGVLADDQTPAAHSATKHDQTVEATANKGEANGYAPLDGSADLPLPNLTPACLRLGASTVNATPVELSNLTLAHTHTLQPTTANFLLVMASLQCDNVVAGASELSVAFDLNGVSSPIFQVSLPAAGFKVPITATHGFLVVDREQTSVVKLYVGPTLGGPLLLQHFQLLTIPIDGV